eukprot:scaffold101595_cov63-Phaeocystis_antarctica.AAC.3
MALIALLTMATRYHLIKITKRNIADFDFRLKVCARHHTYMHTHEHAHAHERAMPCEPTLTCVCRRRPLKSCERGAVEPGRHPARVEELHPARCVGELDCRGASKFDV